VLGAVESRFNREDDVRVTERGVATAIMVFSAVMAVVCTVVVVMLVMGGL